MFIVPLLKLPKGTNNPQVIHQMRNGLQMWYVCTMDYYLAVKKNKIPIDATVGINFAK